MRIFRYIQISLLIALPLIGIIAQNDIRIQTARDSSVVGLDIPLDISVNPNSNLKKFNIAVLDRPAIQRIYKDKYNFQQQDTTEETDVDFEISDFGKWTGQDKAITIDKSVNPNQIRIKVWDAGAFMVIPYTISESSDTIYPDKLDQYPSLLVFPTMNPNDTIRDFTPIKGIIKENKSWKDYYLYILIGLGLLLLILAAFFVPKLLVKRNKPRLIEEKKKVFVPAHITALKRLKQLADEKIWKDESRIKEYQSKLTFALREYLENRFGIKALEQTTGEIADSLSKLSINEEDNNTIKNILQIADLVKFAKAKPGEDIHKKFLDETIDFVNRTKEEVQNINNK